MFSEILEISQGKTSSRVYFLIKLQKVAKFLRTLFFTEKLRWLLLIVNGIITGQFKINSIRSKFDDILKGGRGNIDILMISETKLD